jgi:hypothetical protein
MRRTGLVQSDPQYRMERRNALVCTAAVGIFSLLLACGQLYLATKLDYAAELATSPKVSNMLLSLKMIFRGSALVLASFALLQAVAFLNVRKLIKRIDG